MPKGADKKMVGHQKCALPAKGPGKEQHKKTKKHLDSNFSTPAIWDRKTGVPQPPCQQRLSREPRLSPSPGCNKAPQFPSTPSRWCHKKQSREVGLPSHQAVMGLPPPTSTRLSMGTIWGAWTSTPIWSYQVSPCPLYWVVSWEA